MKIEIAKPEHEALYSELLDIVRRHADKMSSIQVLAIAANMVGKIVAMQDQRTVTPELAMHTVFENIKAGNMEAIRQISETVGQA